GASVRANVYASDIKLNGSLNAGIIVPGGNLTLSYILNENATAGVSLRIYSGANVIRTFTAANGLPGTFAGLNSFRWDGTMSNGVTVSPGIYTVSITAASEGYSSWTAITDDSTNFSVFYPSAITVNRNTNSPYYGRVFVGNCGAGGDPPISVGILKYNADGSPADEGGFGTGGYPWTGGDYFNPSPWKMGVSGDDRLYVDDWTAGGVVLSFDQVLSTNYLPVLGLENYPYPTILLSGPCVLGAGLNTQILMADINVASAGGLGVLRWDLTSNGETATNDTGTQIIATGNGSDLNAAPFDMAEDANGNIYVIQRIDEYSPVSPINDLTSKRVLCFPPYQNGSPAEIQALWQVGGGDPSLENAYGVAVNPPATLVAVAARGEGDDSSSLEYGGLSIFLATNGTLVTNINQDLMGSTNQQMVAVAWDNVGNLYAADWTDSIWRVYSPPGGNQATTAAVPLVQALNALLPPALSSPSYTVVSSELSFSLLGQSNVTYVIEQSSNLLNWTPVATNYSPSPGRAISIPVPSSDDQDFYRAMASP
ncbi:MAG: FlgD immunoglobulin-like domain containing protein, partial [Limisphaerales bacterium]